MESDSKNIIDYVAHTRNTEYEVKDVHVMPDKEIGSNHKMVIKKLDIEERNSRSAPSENIDRKIK